ncbi:MAG: maleylpyruvate isomerase N-terminal domain-containing protein, partial [Chloroflexi bacterium]|nr:maleylpyruvate isomerase N-terminal domain-containing protein [Chloroflexota bacterium]
PEQLSPPSPCAGWSIREVMNHSIGVTHKRADFAAGRTDQPHPPAGISLASTITRRFARPRPPRKQRGDQSTTRLCHLPFGTFPADVAAGINLLDVLAQTWDIAAAANIGINDDDEEVWTIGFDAARGHRTRSRPSHYAPAVPAPMQASPMVLFLAFLGRTVGGYP